MEKEQIFTLRDLRIRPYDPTSRVAQEFPGFELIEENRRDFVLFKALSHLAVAFTVVNHQYGDRRYRTRTRQCYVKVYDSKTYDLVVEKAFTVTMSQFQEEMEMRVDVPITADKVVNCREYWVSVESEQDGVEDCGKMIRFFRISKTLYRYFHLESAYIKVADDDTTHYRSVEGQREGQKYILWRFTKEKSGLMDDCPEMRVRVRSVKGHMWDYYTEAHSGSGAFWLDDPNKDTDKLTLVYTPITEGMTNDDICYVELQCLGYPVASFFLDCRHTKQGEWKINELPLITSYHQGDDDSVNRVLSHLDKIVTSLDDTIAGIHKKMDTLVGLPEVKHKLDRYSNTMRFFMQRRLEGLPELTMPLHAVFMGAPGTGKTTVAKMMGEMLSGLGVLSKGHVVARERSTLLGQYYSSEGENTLKALNEAQGGILFIDEAYQLYQPEDPRDPGRYVLEPLMTALADENKRDWKLIIAGYTEPMKKMLDCNPGLRSRLPETNHYFFSDFSGAELMEIARRYLTGQGFVLSAGASWMLEEVLEHDSQHRTKAFGNGRHVMNMIQTQIIPAMAARLATIAKPTPEDLSLILPEDIPAPTTTNTPRRMGFQHAS